MREEGSEFGSWEHDQINHNTLKSICPKRGHRFPLHSCLGKTSWMQDTPAGIGGDTQVKTSQGFPSQVTNLRQGMGQYIKNIIQDKMEEKRKGFWLGGYVKTSQNGTELCLEGSLHFLGQRWGKDFPRGWINWTGPPLGSKEEDCGSANNRAWLEYRLCIQWEDRKRKWRPYSNRPWMLSFRI